MAKVGKYSPKACFPIDEPRRESFSKSSFTSVIKEQLSFEYKWRGLENDEVVDTEVVTEEGFNVYLVSWDNSVGVTVECDKEIMRLVDQER